MQKGDPNQDVIDAVERMQQYIADHLKEPITARQLAAVAGYSQYHSARIFSELLGIAPFEYIRRLRLTSSALTLRDENAKVVDVALDYVFDSHEGFTRAFSKEFGITPKKYARRPKPVSLFRPYSIRGFYRHKNKAEGKTMSETAKVIFTQVVERPARKLILRRGIKAADYFEYCAEVGCDVWGVLASVKEALYEPVGLWLPKNFRPAGTSEYAQGVEVPPDYSGEIPEGFEVIDLPACKMLVFQGEPYNDEDFEEAIGELWAQAEKFNPAIYGYEYADDLAPRMQLEPQGWRGYIEMRPVNETNSKQA
jgi:AraC family transcriptional regulator